MSGGGWMFLWMMVALKIPIGALLYLVWWAVRSTPAPADGEVARVKPLPHHRPGGRRPRWPGPPRRGPHAEPTPLPPQRTRAVATARARTLR